MIEFIYSLFPAIFLSVASVLLIRLREIDLSLDQQCFFVGAMQAIFFHFSSGSYGIAAVIMSFLLVFFLLYFRIRLNMFFKTNSMIMSLSFGMILIGVCLGLIWLFGIESRQPQYPHWISRPLFYSISAIILLVIIGCDQIVSLFIKSTIFPGRISMRILSQSNPLYLIISASILITLAGTLLALHANSVTAGFAGNIGILVAAMSMITYGRIIRALAFGVLVGFFYWVGLRSSFFSNSDLFKSYLFPVFQLFIVYFYSLCSNKVRF